MARQLPESFNLHLTLIATLSAVGASIKPAHLRTIARMLVNLPFGVYIQISPKSVGAYNSNNDRRATFLIADPPVREDDQ
jgi:hypothetical protein